MPQIRVIWKCYNGLELMVVLNKIDFFLIL
jgi:hypothetical protein